MAKFLNKKQQVIDFQLTPYGKHRLSVGQLKPSHYAFFDTGVIYDSEYAGFKESQTKIHERIKTETQFIEGIMFFNDAENTVEKSLSEYSGEDIAVAAFRVASTGELYLADTTAYTEYISELKGSMGFGGVALSLSDLEYMTLGTADEITLLYSSTAMYDMDIHPKKVVPKPNILSFESSIGDARFEGDNTQAAPAWKLLTCQGEISKVETKDKTKYNFTSASFDNEFTEYNIPQVDVKANYTLLVGSPTDIMSQEVPSDFISQTKPFLGGNTIRVVSNDIVLYAEEMNTELLSENFEVEVFEMNEDTEKGCELSRKFFANPVQQIVDGFMVAANPKDLKQANVNSSATEYYFELLTDSNVNGKIACSCANTFNKNSYYIDIDFDCTEDDIDKFYYDIYGSATAPEICDTASQRQVDEDDRGFIGDTASDTCEDE
jgi:hypothetical protein